MDQLLLTGFLSMLALAALGQAALTHPHHDPHEKLYEPPGRIQKS